MKKRFILFLGLIPFFSLVGCNNGGGVKDPIPYKEPDPETKTDIVYLGFNETRKYTPNNKVDFTVTVQDTSLLTYDTNTLFMTSYTKKGTTLVTFTSNKLTYNVTVTVQDDGTAPLLKIDEENVQMDKGKTFKVNMSLSYRGVDTFAQCDGLHYTKENETPTVTSLAISGKEITITSSNVGEDKYTIYTTFLGHTLSKTLNIKVVENKAFVVIGSKISYNDLGPIYDISMYNYNANKINLKNDLSVTKSGQMIPYENLNVSITDTSVAEVINNEIVVKKVGTTKMTVTYGLDSKDIQIRTYKPVIETKTMTVSNQKFNLQLDRMVGSTSSTYAGSTEVTKAITINKGTHTFLRAYSVSVNAEERLNTSLKPINYDGTTNVTLTAASFDIYCAGKKDVSLLMEANEYLVQYKFDLDFVTYNITSKTDFVKYIPMKVATEAVFGNYTLGADIDMGNSGSGVYCANAAFGSYGFRGTLDGAKSYDSQGNPTGVYSLNNYKADAYGLSITIGDGAIIKNLNINAKEYNMNLSPSLFARFIFGATFLNLNMTFDSASNLNSWGIDTDKCGVGIICSQKVEDSFFKDCTINASGKTITCLCGKSSSNNKWDNFVIKCSSIGYYSSGTVWDTIAGIPKAGVKFTDTSIPGIIIQK